MTESQAILNGKGANENGECCTARNPIGMWRGRVGGVQF